MIPRTFPTLYLAQARASDALQLAGLASLAHATRACDDRVSLRRAVVDAKTALVATGECMRANRMRVPDRLHTAAYAISELGRLLYEDAENTALEVCDA